MSDLSLQRSASQPLVSGLRKGWYARAASWLKRSSKPSGWRPKPKKRVKSFVFLKALNNAIRVSLPLVGLRHFRQPKDKALRCAPAWTWPSMTLTSVSGSDILAGVNFLCRSLTMSLNLDWVPDFNHASWNGFRAAAKGAGLWRHALLLLMSQLMRHGPWQQASRLQQVREALDHYMRVAHPASCPLFAQFYPQILADKGIAELLGAPGLLEKVWEELKEAKPWHRQGTPVNLNRWFQVLAEARSDDGNWSSRCMAQTIACIECDLLHGARFDALLRELHAKAGGLITDDSGRSMMKDTTSEQRSLSSAVSNLLVVSTMTLSDPDNQRKTRLLFKLAEPLETWQKFSNKRLRCVQESCAWKQEQQASILQMLSDIVGMLQDSAVLEFLGFTRPSSTKEIQAGLRVTDDDFAQFMGDLAFGVVKEMLVREVWLLRGWPARTCLMLANRPEATEEVNLFRKDWLAFEALQQRVADGEPYRLLQERSLFNLVAVQQLVA